MRPIFKTPGRQLSWSRKLWRWGLLLLATLLLCVGALATWVYWDLPDTAAFNDPRFTLTVEVPDWQGARHPFLLGPKNPQWAPLESIPDELKWAVIVAEDGNFYEHKGIDVPALKEALKYDLKRKRLVRGASTITQQLAKNLYLSRDKSLLRKLRELVIAQSLEHELSKGRILELYLNLVELGPLVYGVEAGARYHFDLPVSILTPAEGAWLAAILPGPRQAYNPQLHPVKVRQRAARLIKLLGLRHILTETEVADARDELEQLGVPGAAADPSGVYGD
jgi:monofunctional glycosyltransferase